ncbi:MAG: uracil-DNA glycosylase [Puniceicoccales bacterium]|jgi:DNA polymerase|nr:uracil-DNA glycosylase [Puniceicoccales bacterium]
MRDDVCKELKNLLNIQTTLYEKSEFPLDAGVLQKFLQTARRAVTMELVSATSRAVSMPSTPSLIEEDLIPTSEQLILPSGSKQECWQWLKNRVLTCPTCLSHVHPGKKVVFGSGNLDADIFFCGEAPGADEEEQGEVFVGRAGQLLTKIIEAMGLHRSTVYIGNIMNWRPETPNMIGNRPPTQAEMEFCLPYLKGQVDIVQPKVIVALGATAVNGLLGHDASRRMRDCRGQWFSFHKIPLLVTYHPSYLLRNATKEAKRIVWEDMLHVMEFLHIPISDKQKRYFL